MSAQLLLLLVPTILITQFETRDIKTFLRLKPPKFSQLVLSVIGVFSLGQALQVIVLLQEKIPLPSSVQTMIDDVQKLMERAFGVLVNSDSIPELLVVIFIVAVVPSLCEELLFRGLVQRNFENSFSATDYYYGILFGAYSIRFICPCQCSTCILVFSFVQEVWVSDAHLSIMPCCSRYVYI